MSKKVFLLFLTFFLIEGALQVFSLVWFDKKPVFEFKKDHFSIVVLGESTSQKQIRDGRDMSWPAVLEEKLKAKEKKFKFII